MKTMIDKINLCSLILWAFLSLALSCSSWAQEPKDVDTSTKTKEENAEQTVIEKEQTAKTPQRQHGRIDRPIATTTLDKEIKELASHFSSKSIRWIDNNPPFFAIWQADRSGKAKGALLILHAQGEHPSWPQTTKPLHDSLPDYGWATLAISLPAVPRDAIPARTLPAKVHPSAITDKTSQDTKATKEASPETTATPEEPSPKPEKVVDNSPKHNEFSKKIETRLTAALKFLHDQGQFNIAILGNGDNAIYAEKFMQSITPDITEKKLKDRFEKPIRALLIFNGSQTLKHEKEPYTEWFKDPDIPVFDLFSAHQKQYQQYARHRQIIAKRKRVTRYAMVRIPEMSHETSWRENRLSRRIRSFLDAEVKGIEVDNASLKKNN